MIILLGAPGSGKGTQARFLSKSEGYKIFSVGEILRKEIEKKTKIGLKVADCINSGKFADIELVISLMREHITTENCILDGFPRNLNQACELDNFIRNHQFLKIDKTIVLDFIIPIEILQRRLKNRKLCCQCDASMVISDLYCTFCNHKAEDAYIRNDDKTEVLINNRLKIFEEETSLLRDFYKTKVNYYIIDGNKSHEKVFQQVRSCIINNNLI